MILSLLILLVAVGCFYAGLKFYKLMDWQEEPEPSPDLRQMHKKQAELQHIQELLADAQAQGKLSQTLIDEFARYSDKETEAMRVIEKTWVERKSKSQEEETRL